MNRNWKEALKKKQVLIADGAWGTELTRVGLPTGVTPEQWNLENAASVQAVAAAYVEAGADIVLTNTFGGNAFKLAKAGLGDHVEEINRLGVELSRKAAGDRALVFASIGPTGEFLEPLGETTEVEMIEAFAQQATACADGGADAFVIETMTDLGEAKAALAAVRQATSLPVVVSMTFDKNANGYATMMGVSPAQAAKALDEAGADLIGTNCGSGIEDMVKIIEEMRSATDKSLWAKPNAGMPELVGGKTVFRDPPESMVRYLPLIVEAGAHVLGGCCGTTPDHVRLFAMERNNVVCGCLGYLQSMVAMKA
jgi:5-methyltetrahydrofolate--homocysteine methyltransferase